MENIMEDYVEALLQKYRFAVVLAVLRNKPSNMSVEDYIIKLRNQILESDAQFNVNDDDFNMSDDELEFYSKSVGGGDVSVESISIFGEHYEGKRQETQQVTKDLVESSETPQVDKPPKKVLSLETLVTEKNTDNNIEYPHNAKEEEKRVITNLNREHIDENPTQSVNTYDSQATNCNSLLNESYTHISQTQENLFSVKINPLTKARKTKTTIEDQKTVSSLNTLQEIDFESQFIQTRICKQLKPIVYTESMETDTQIHSLNITAETQYNSTNLTLQQASNKAYQLETVLFNGENTNIYREEIDCIDLITPPHILIDDVTVKADKVSIAKESNFHTEFIGLCQNIESSDSDKPMHSNSVINSKIIDSPVTDDINNAISIDNLRNDLMTQDMLCSLDNNELQYMTKKPDSLNEYSTDSDSMDIDFNLTPLKALISKNDTESKDNEPSMIEEKTNSNNMLLSNELKRLTESQDEIIPFKIIGALQKVKSYLNKYELSIDTQASASGFKSGRFSYNASQSSQWLNLSAHSLFSYLSEAPLLVSNTTINCEIAKVLGELIDRLHESEQYPTFVEEILEFVANLTLTIYEGENDDDNTFFKTDTCIERLLLFNKSNNIMRFTIEKIVKLLESFHQLLEKDEVIELSNINRTENIAYIFHILEILLREYTKSSQNFSQSTKLSQIQSEESLKRSTLTEIWRRKWNLITDDVVQKEERDILIDCSDILNRIVVKAMEKYSIVAYAALQCFNLLQS